jgi:ABC-type lipoprotein export system ATPase subunit/GNAT superfamily N-acetyltransferase
VIHLDAIVAPARTATSGRSRRSEVERAFGLTAARSRVLVPPVAVPDRGVVLVVGPSGAGKSTLLRAVAARAGCATMPELPDDDRSAIDLIDGDVADAIGLLSRFGLAEAAVLVAPARRLSEGQQFRLRLAMLLSRRPVAIAVDELLSVLDRGTAQAIAFALQKHCRRHGVTAYLATAHDDLVEALAPDWVVRIGAGATVRVEPGPTVARVPALDRVVVEDGTLDDYFGLAHYHYAHDDAEDLARRVAQVRTARLDGTTLAVAVYVTPYRTDVGVPLLAELAQRVWMTARTVVHPSVRGAGLSRRLEPTPPPGVRAVFQLSALARFFPFQLAHGYRAVDTTWSERRGDHDRLIALLARAGVNDPHPLHDPEHASAVMAELSSTERAAIRRLAVAICASDDAALAETLAAASRVACSSDDREELVALYAAAYRVVARDDIGRVVADALPLPMAGLVRELP